MKACKHCVHFDGKDFCQHRHLKEITPDMEVCEEFTAIKKPTNGDEIRQTGDELKEENKKLRYALGAIALNALFEVLHLPNKERYKSNTYCRIAGYAISTLSGAGKKQEVKDGE